MNDENDMNVGNKKL